MLACIIIYVLQVGSSISKRYLNIIDCFCFLGAINWKSNWLVSSIHRFNSNIYELIDDAFFSSSFPRQYEWWYQQSLKPNSNTYLNCWSFAIDSNCRQNYYAIDQQSTSLLIKGKTASQQHQQNTTRQQTCGLLFIMDGCAPNSDLRTPLPLVLGLIAEPSFLIDVRNVCKRAQLIVSQRLLPLHSTRLVRSRPRAFRFRVRYLISDISILHTHTVNYNKIWSLAAISSVIDVYYYYYY